MIGLEQAHKDLELLEKYVDIHIQLLSYVYECKISKYDMSTFEYFKETYNDHRYSLLIPHFKEAKEIYDGNRFGIVHTEGMGTTDGVAYRYFNYWKGCKIFTDENLQGNYTVNS